MSSGRHESVHLSEVARLDLRKVKVEPNQSYSIVGVLNAGQGLFLRGDVAGSETKYTRLHQLAENQLVMRKLTAWEGPITVVGAAFAGGFVSSEFPTFTLDQTRVDPAYLRVVCRSPVFWDEMRRRSTGTAERRSRLTPGELLIVSVPLPPLEQQRWIADVVEKFDDLASAYLAEQAAGESLLRAAREAWLENAGTVDVGHVIERIQSGKSPKAEERAPEAGEQGVLKVSAIRPGEFRPSEAKAVTNGTSFPDHAIVRPGDVLISRANTRALVGATCMVSDTPENLFLSDKTLRLVYSASRIAPEYLVHALASQHARAQIKDAATGTSESMKNISQDAIRAVRIPYYTDMTEQRRVACELDALQTAAQSAARLHRSARRLTAVLIDDLLSGRVDAELAAGHIEAA